MLTSGLLLACTVWLDTLGPEGHLGTSEGENTLFSIPLEIRTLSLDQDKAQDEEEEDEKQEEEFPSQLSIRGGIVFSLKAEVEKLDPFYGGGVVYRWYTSKKDFSEIGADIFFGSGEAELCVGATCVEEEFDDRIFWIYGNMGTHFNEETAPEGWTMWAGLGFAVERGDNEVTVAGTTIETDIEGESFTLQAGAGYTTEKVEVGGTLLWFAGSENVTIAGVLSLAIRF